MVSNEHALIALYNDVKSMSLQICAAAFKIFQEPEKQSVGKIFQEISGRLASLSQESACGCMNIQHLKQRS